MHGTTSPFPSTSDRLQSPQQYKLYHCHSSARSTGKLPTVHVQMILLFFRIASAQLSCCFQPNHIVEGYSWDLLLVGVKLPSLWTQNKCIIMYNFSAPGVWQCTADSQGTSQEHWSLIHPHPECPEHRLGGTAGRGHCHACHYWSLCG